MTSGSCRCLHKPALSGHVATVAGNPSRCLVILSLREPRSSLCLPTKLSETCAAIQCGDRIPLSAVNRSTCRHTSSLHRASSSPRGSAVNAFSVSDRRDDDATERGRDSDSDSDSDHETGSDRLPDSLHGASPEANALKELASSPLLPGSSKILEPESWLLIRGDDVPTVVSSLPLRERYAPHRLLEFLKKKIDTGAVSPEQLKNSLMFWKKKEELQEDALFAASAFGEQGVSDIHQWTATELTLQHVRLSRIARDILYLVLACSLLGIVRVLEAIVVTFSSRPPHFSRLLEASNSLDFFTMAFLAYSVRKPVIGILRVDPMNLDDVVQLKSKIWDEMHKFYERQWKLVATLAVGRLLALIAQKLPSTNLLTRNIKMGWDFLLALPIF